MNLFVSAPGALPEPLHLQLFMGPGRGPQASGEVAGRAGAPPAGEHLYTNPGCHSDQHVCEQNLFMVQEQYQRDQERLEAEWRRAQQDAVEGRKFQVTKSSFYVNLLFAHRTQICLFIVFSDAEMYIFRMKYLAP